MTGPPTPPPSSAIEIEDATRTAEPMEATPAAPDATEVAAEPEPPQPEPVAMPVEAPEPTQPTPTSFRIVFDTLTKLAVDGRIAELIETAEVADLTPVNAGHIDHLLVITPLVLSYLVLDDAEPAISAISRLPDGLKALPIPDALFQLVASTSNRRYENVYARAEILHNAVQQAPVPGADLLVVVDVLLNKFLDAFRLATFALLSKAYSSIPLTTVQSYLGWPAERVLAAASDYQWRYDASNGILSPTPVPKNGIAHVKGTVYGVSSLTTFDLIANSNLE